MSILDNLNSNLENLIQDLIDKATDLAELKVYKLVEGELTSMEVTVVQNINGEMKRVIRPVSEYIGWKILEIDPELMPNVYQEVETYYEENLVKIYQRYRLVTRNLAEVVALNEEFWAREYFQITPLLPDLELYAPYTSYLNGEAHSLIKDDYAILLMGASAGQLTHLELYSKPDMSQELTNEYIESLKVLITDEAQMGAILGYFGTLNYGARTVPAVL